MQVIADHISIILLKPGLWKRLFSTGNGSAANKKKTQLRFHLVWS